MSGEENLLGTLASAMKIEGIVGDHRDLESDDLPAALEFGTLVSVCVTRRQVRRFHCRS
jgi:hypothetical protein